MNNQQEILRGQIYYANLDPALGSEQGGIRPVLILQNNLGNAYSPTVITAPITSQMKKMDQPTHVPISSFRGLARCSMVMLEQVRTIDKQRLRNYVGRLDDEIMDQVGQALCVSLGTGAIRKKKRPFMADKQQEPEDKPKEMTLCLCAVCASQFISSPDHIILRVDPLQKKKDTCTYCDFREGYDYRIISRKKQLGSDRY